MTTGGMIFAIVGLLASLFLALRGLQSRGLTFHHKVRMAFAWVAIIGGVALVMTWLTGR